MRGKDYASPIVELAETAWYKDPTLSQAKVDPRWDVGIWPGRDVGRKRSLITQIYRAKLFVHSILKALALTSGPPTGNLQGGDPK